MRCCLAGRGLAPVATPAGERGRVRGELHRVRRAPQVTGLTGNGGQAAGPSCTPCSTACACGQGLQKQPTISLPMHLGPDMGARALARTATHLAGSAPWQTVWASLGGSRCRERSSPKPGGNRLVAISCAARRAPSRCWAAPRLAEPCGSAGATCCTGWRGEVRGEPRASSSQFSSNSPSASGCSGYAWSPCWLPLATGPLQSAGAGTFEAGSCSDGCCSDAACSPASCGAGCCCCCCSAGVCSVTRCAASCCCGCCRRLPLPESPSPWRRCQRSLLACCSAASGSWGVPGSSPNCLDSVPEMGQSLGLG